jgi:transmembrane sensor
MTFQEFDAMLGRYIQDTATEDERRLVEAWFDSMEVDVEDLASETHAQMRERLWANLNPEENRISVWKKYRAIAASLVVLAVSTFLINRYYIQPSDRDAALTATGKPLKFSNTGVEPQQVSLEDGTAITLQPGSTVVVPHAFGDKREVELSGEAFFKVAHDPRHPFYVYSRGVTTRVLGTSFNIKANEQGREVVVSVRTGRVSVSAPGVNETAGAAVGKEVILTPNQEVVYDLSGQQAEKKLVEVPQVVLEHATLPSSYVNESVVQILEELEKIYGVDIQYDATRLSNCTLTSDMSEEGLYERIDIVCNAIGARYKISETTIRVEAAGCK